MSDHIITFLALLGLFYQLYLQRIHNEKSLQPLVRIDFRDREGLVYVHIENNGVGPLIIEKLTFFKNEVSFDNIEDCLSLDPKSYQHIFLDKAVNETLLPGGYHEVFSTRFEEKDTSEEIASVRRQLSVLYLKVEGRDVYNNKVVAERDLQWFARHTLSNDTVIA